MKKINGLSDEEVINNRKKYGTNSIDVKRNNKFINILIDSLNDPIIKILLIALGVKLIFLFKDFDWFETIGIIVAILVASLISSLSEYGSEKAFIKMEKEASKIKCKVIRNGCIKETNIDDIVVDDLIVLESGDKIPADGYLIDGSIEVDESSINGETKEVYKEKIDEWKNTINDSNKVYRGTVVYSNKAIMKVKEIGKNTLYGKVCIELNEKQRESPLKIKLTKLAQIISKIGYISAFLVSFSYLFSVIIIKNNFDINLIKNTIFNAKIMSEYLIYALTLSVTIIVVAVPEGLPMMITLVLSSNMKRMLKNNVLVRKLVGIETAGSINLLLTDKTGTLTYGKLETIGIINGNLEEFFKEEELINYKKYHNKIKDSIIYNTSSTIENNKIIGGNITDKAIISFIKSNIIYDKKIIKTIPFDSKNKYSIVEILDNDKKIKYIKGSPELIIPKCNYYYDKYNEKIRINHTKLNKYIDSLLNNGLRLIALAEHNNTNIDNLSNLTLIGIVIIKDKVRDEAKEAVKMVKNAQIQTIMITGDNKLTAQNIAKETGIIDNDDDMVLTSEEFNKLSDEEVKKILKNIKVISRSLPIDKSRLVKIAQELNLVVGMTGDGVNDAAALKKADVGFSMGSGTEVSKEASDIVILDDNFLSITKAILFGRTIFKSIRKFIIVQLTINFCAISLSIVCPFIGIDTPVTVIQMLWINMVMDTLAGLAFAYEPPLSEYMNESPKKRDESIINKYMLSEIFFTGIYSFIICILLLKAPFISNLFRDSNDKIYLMTAFFGLFIFIDIFNSFNARTSRLDILSNVSSNKMFILIMSFITIIQVLLIYFGGNLFRTSGLTFKEFIVMFLLALSVIPIDWIRKILFRKKYGYSSV